VSGFDLDELHRLNSKRAVGPWFASGGYPQRISNSAALVIAETFHDPDRVADDAEFIAYVGTHMDEILGLIERARGGTAGAAE